MIMVLSLAFIIHTKNIANKSDMRKMRKNVQIPLSNQAELHYNDMAEDIRAFIEKLKEARKG